MLSPHHRKFARKLDFPHNSRTANNMKPASNTPKTTTVGSILKKQDMWRKRYFLATLCSLETCGCSGYSCCHCGSSESCCRCQGAGGGCSGRSGHRLAILITLDNLDILKKSEPRARTFSIFDIVFVDLDTPLAPVYFPGSMTS